MVTITRRTLFCIGCSFISFLIAFKYHFLARSPTYLHTLNVLQQALSSRVALTINLHGWLFGTYLWEAIEID